MENVNKICPKCGNANYVVSLSEFSKVFPYKCINCNSYLTDEDFTVNSGELKEHGMVTPERRYINPDPHFDTYRCMGCDYMRLHYGQRYCGGCGNAVKWNDT